MCKMSQAARASHCITSFTRLVRFGFVTSQTVTLGSDFNADTQGCSLDIAVASTIRLLSIALSTAL